MEKSKQVLRAAIPILVLAVALTAGTGCRRPDAGEPVYATAYDFFDAKFARGSKGEFSSEGGVHTVTCGGGSFTLDPAEFSVVVCTPGTWPAVTLEDGTWHLDGEDLGIPLAGGKSTERILAVICDGEGIYVRLSSGGMFYFHRDRVLEVGCFRFEKALNPSLDGDVICTVGGGTISGDAGTISRGTELIPTFGCRGEMSIGGTAQVLTGSVTPFVFTGDPLRLSLDRGSDKWYYDLSLTHGLRIPSLRIDTRGQGAPTSKEEYITVSLAIEDPYLLFSDTASETLTTEIRGRGNSTWSQPKKPYKIKLDKKKRMFGMSDNRHWNLMANYNDKSLLRNAVAFKISDLAGMSWSPRWIPVELYMDNVYEGQYMLTEQVRTGDGRIEIEVAEPSDNSGEALTGGYLLAVDEKDLDPGWGVPKVGYYHVNASGSRFPVAFDEPEEPVPEQIEYVKSYLKDVEEAIYRGSFDRMCELIDVDSFIQQFFVQELAKNVDGNMRLSTYLVKPRGGKLYFPCVWDFDIAFGNCDYVEQGIHGSAPDGWVLRDAVWFRQLFRNPEFCELVIRRWEELYPRLAQLEPWTRGWASDLDRAQRRNFVRWPILGVKIWPNVNDVPRTSYREEIDHMLGFIDRRIAWLDGELRAGRHRIY